MRRSALAEDLKELAWAIFLLDLIAGLVAALLASLVGGPTAVLFGAAAMLMITLTLGAIAAANVALIAIMNALERRRAHRAHRAAARTPE